jgi:CRISPR-associated protein Csb1
MNIDKKAIEAWATDPNGPVALHLKQTLTSVECIDLKSDPCVIYPPTYADIGYNIDVLADGKKAALVDSVGSQANRMEPFFKCEDATNALVPQIQIAIGPKPPQDGGFRETRSLLDIAHRGADAVVQSSGELAVKLRNAFSQLKQSGNAAPLATIAPTSLLFGVWDSRGGSGEKRPRLIRSIIRAWDVEVLHSAAQFNSIWKALDEDQRDELKKEATKQKVKLSVKGFHDAPGVFRDTKVSRLKDGGFNPEARILGGVLVNGRIERDITINLVALRGLRGGDNAETKALRSYLLGLALTAATADIDLFLREGCHLRYIGDEQWHAVPRRGAPEEIDLGSDHVKKIIADYVHEAATPFREKWSNAIGASMEFEFDIKAAKELLKKKGEEEEDPQANP